MPIISTSLTLLVVITCLSLAHWQYHRAQVKQQNLDTISNIQSQGTMSRHEFSKLATSFNKTGIILKRSGQLKSKQYWLLDNRVFKQQVGFDVLAIFTPDHNDQAIIVNLGWVKAPPSRAQFSAVDLPTQTVTLKLQLKQGDLAGFYLQKQQPNNGSWPKRIQYIDLLIMQQESGIQLQDFIGYSKRAQFSLQPHYQPVVMPPEKHLAYALQWLLLAVGALLVFIFAVKPFQRHISLPGE